MRFRVIGALERVGTPRKTRVVEGAVGIQSTWKISRIKTKDPQLWRQAKAVHTNVEPVETKSVKSLKFLVVTKYEEKLT